MGEVKAERLEHVHMIAVGGTGMGSLAGLLRGRGIRVTGSDAQLYPPMSVALERWGVSVTQGFRPDNVLDDPPDLVVIGNAVRADNPEARAAIDVGLPYRSFPDALYELAIAGKHSVVVAGTHGKTTTTGMLATVLDAVGLDPSFLVGGILEGFGGSFREGFGEHFVVEGDEYDTAFFDKTPKFLHYAPHTALISSIEFDHADIYEDLDHVKRAFRTLVSGMPAEGTLLAHVADPHVAEVVAQAPCPVVGYAVDPRQPVAWEARGLTATPEGTGFRLVHEAEVVARVEIPLHGRHNVANALAALVTAHTLGVPIDAAVAGIERYRGVKRRQETRGEVGGITVIDDFAHHPTAVRETLAGMRTRYPDRRLVVAFEPRSNTSRRNVFRDEYLEALSEADVVWIARVPDAPIYSATGEVSEFLDTAGIASQLRERGKQAESFEDAVLIASRLADDCRPGDVVLVMSNGDFGGLIPKLLERLGESS
ncbi:MAG: UDP-N-acetylmuramate:L-alanyl-gamma-D-glutamyl-meso-diaminopimelate ligase [Myxococcota bacterium]